MRTVTDGESPYGIFATTPELIAANDFAEDYSIAFQLGRSLDLASDEQVGKTIVSAVSETLGPNISSARVLAVAALATQARVRYLRREDWRTQKELKAIRREMWPPFNIKIIKRERALLKRQIEIYKEQGACFKADGEYLSVSRQLENDFSPLMSE